MISGAEFAHAARLFPSLRALLDDEREDFVAATHCIAVADRTPVFTAGRSCEHFLWLTDGCVRVVARDDEGREVLLYRVLPGELCVVTTSCALGHVPYPAHGITEGASRALALDVGRFEDLVIRSSVLRHQVFASLSTRLREVMEGIDRFAFRSLEDRICAWLRSTHRRVDSQVLRASHQEIADDLGCAREPVSRILAQLAAEGRVQLGRRRIELLDPALLSGAEGSGHGRMDS